MKPEIQKKINACKALNGMSVADLIATDRFRDNLAGYMTEQRETRKMAISSYQAMRKLGANGYKLPSHPIDRVINMTVEDFAIEFAKIICGGSKRNASERRYIQQLGQQAYNLTIAQYVVDEFPELSDELIPKTNTN